MSRSTNTWVLALLLIFSISTLIKAQSSTSCTIDYNNPGAWGTMCNGAWTTCSAGKSQSPISIVTSQTTQDHNLPETRLNFRPTYAVSYNRSGLAEIEIYPKNESAFSGGPLSGRHFLRKISFHAPSEHAFDNFRASAAAQFWFHDSSGDPSVILDLMFIDNTHEPNPWIDTVLSAMRKNSTTTDLSPQGSFPLDLTYYYYSGSSTTPPCEEGWVWMILINPVPITLAQVGAIRSWQGVDKIRPLQPLYLRNVSLEYSHIIVEEDPNTFVAFITVAAVVCVVAGLIAVCMQRQVAQHQEAKAAEKLAREALLQTRPH